MATESIVTEYIVEVGKLKARLKEVEASYRKAEATGKSSMSGVGKAVDGIGDQLKEVGKTLIAAFAVAEILKFGSESVKAFQEAELNAKKLQFALQNIGKEGGAAFAKLIEQSEKLQDTSIFSDDDIQRAQTQLVQFGLTSDEIEKLIPKILDLASATGTDLGQATDTVIMGVNGVTRGLKPLGLEFVNTGDKAQNLAIITDKLNKYQGQTQAILETSSGSWKRFANVIDDAKEGIGAFLLSYVDQFSAFGKIIGAIFDKLTGRTKELSGPGGKSFLEKYAEASEEGKNKLIIQQEKAIALIEKTNATFNLKTSKDVSATLRAISVGVNEAKRLRDELDAALNPKGTNLGLTEEEKAKREAEAETKRVKALEDRKKLNAEANALEQELAVSKIKTIQSAEEKAAEEKDKLMQEQLDKTKENAELQIAINKGLIDQKARDERAAAEEKQALRDAEIQASQELLTAISDFNQAALNTDLSNLQAQLDAKEITQEQFDQRSREAKRSAAENDKALAIFQTTINTAAAIIKMLADPGGIPGIILSVAAGVAGAAQIALIASQSIPAFATGTEYVKRGRNRPGRDTIPALLNEGEAIIQTDQNVKYPGLAAAWNGGSLHKYILSNYVVPAIKEYQQRQEKQSSEGFAKDLASALILNQKGFYDGNLIASDQETRKQAKDNAKLISRSISEASSGKSILRKRGFNV